MKRSINFSLNQSDTIERCREERVRLFSSAALPDGGTRVFCKTERGAAKLRLRLREYTIAG